MSTPLHSARWRALLAAALLASLAAGIQAQSGFDEPQLERGSVAAAPPGTAAGEITVVLQLAGDPVAVVRSRRPGKRFRAGEQEVIAQDLARKQDALVPAIRARGALVLARMQHAIDGIKVRGTPNQIAALARLPGVVSVKPVMTYQLDNATSVPFIGAPGVWDGVSGFHGEHVKVAVIDTGIDYTHANFGGPGTVAAFQLASGSSTSAADPALFGPAAPKVKGGTDLVGDNFNAASTDPLKLTPVPDPNPLDCAGHGSHVAGTIGGFGVRADGSTFRGPYDATTPGQAFAIGPGVAPLVDLYAVRVFGCTGSTNVVVEALDWAVANDMQVVNMSLGSNFGPLDSADAEASTNAANAGIIVVASAGNGLPSGGSIPYVLGAPAAGDKVIAVAAMDTKSPQTFAAANAFLTPSGQNIVFMDANGAPFTSGAPLGVVVLRNTNGTVSLGCSESEYVDATIAGKLVVTQRGTCTRTDRVTFGQRHGAAAVAMINSAAGYSQFEDVIPGVTIPFFAVRGAPATDGTVLAQSTAATLTPATPLTDAAYHAFPSFTSMGPRNNDAHLKPDVTGPGVNIFSTAVGTGNAGVIMSGTSMSSPHVAGVAALALQAHENWDPDDVRLAIVNTADPSQIAGYIPRLGGAGVVQALGATRTSVIAEGNDNAPNLSFGFVEFTSDFHAGGDITVRNLGSAAASFNVAAAPAVSASSPHTASVRPSALSLQPGQTGTLHLEVTIAAATTGDATAFREVSGLVSLTPAQPTDNNGVTLNVPYHAMPRARSMITTTIPDGFGPSSPNATSTIVNFSSSVGGAADFYAWGLTGQHPEKGAYGIRAVGVQAYTSGSNRIIQFAVNTYAPWPQLSGEFDISIDSDGDGTADYIVYAGASTFASSPIDRIVALVYNVHTGARTTSGFFVSYTTNQSTLLIPVLASAVGVTGRFTYTAQSFDPSGVSDASTGLGHFNAFTSPISTGTTSAIGPGSFLSVSLAINGTEWALTPALGLMVVSRDNVSGASQAQLLAVPTGVSTLQSITVTPPASSIALGETRQLKAIGQYADGSSRDLTGTVAWTSSGAAVSVDASGVVSGNSPGSAALIITATSGSVSGTATVTVSRTATTTARSASLAHSVVGQAVSFTATVSPALLDTGTPTGTVTFYDGLAVIGGAAVSLTNRSAVITTSALGAGLHSISVGYNGDAGYNESTSLPLAYTVNQASTTTSLTGSPSSSNSGQAVTFTATVAAAAPGAGTPTGTVMFYDGATSIGSAPLDGGAAGITTSTLAAGAHSIAAQFAGDENFSGSGSAALSHTVNPAIVATALVVSSANGSYGGTTTLSATLTSSGAPFVGGAVSFALNGAPIATIATTNADGVATLTDVSLAGINAGTYAGGVHASYAGDAQYASSSATGDIAVAKRTTVPTVTVADKRYDGTTAGTIVNCALAGRLTFDSVSCNGTVVFESATAGQNKVVTVSQLSLTGPAAVNYILSTTTATTVAAIAANHVPVINNPGTQSAYMGVGFTIALSAVDADGDPLTWSPSALPPGLDLTPAGVLSGTPTTLGTFTAAVNVSDGWDTSPVSFSVIVNSPVPGPAAPLTPSGSVETATPVFSWLAVPLTEYYLLSITDASPESPLYFWYRPAEAGCGGGAFTCSVPAPRALKPGQVISQVLTWNHFGYGPWSTPLVATVDLADPSVPTPTPGGPSGVIATRTPIYSWTTVSAAIWYQLSVTDHLGVARESWYTPGDACISSACAVTPPTKVSVGLVQWRIRAWRSTGAGAWSAFLTFDAADGLPGRATLGSPAADGSITTSTPTFTWNAMSTASYYLLHITDRDNVVTERWYRPNEVGCSAGTGMCTASPGILVKAGAASWKVLTWNGSGYGPWSDTRDFLVEIADPSALAPGTVGPTGNITSTNVSYRWTAVLAAVNYRLSIRNNGGAPIYRWYTAEAAGCSGGGECAVIPPIALVNGEAEWQVQAWTASGYGPWSPAVAFTVNVAAPPAAVPIAPSGSAGTAPAFTWNAAVNATYYYVRAFDASGLRIDTWITPSQAGCVTGGVCTVNGGVTFASGSGSWQVLAWNPSGYSPWSSTLTFLVP